MRWARLSLAVGLGFSGLTRCAAASSDNAVNLEMGINQLEFEMANALGRRQGSGRCGQDGGNARCPDNLCCSQFGYCGEGDQFCLAIVGCQTQFGCCGANCGGGAAPPTTTPPTTTRPTTPPTTRPTTPTTSAPVPTGLTISQNAAWIIGTTNHDKAAYYFTNHTHANLAHFYSGPVPQHPSRDAVKHGWHLRKRGHLYRVDLWTMLLSIWVLWERFTVLLLDRQMPTSVWRV